MKDNFSSLASTYARYRPGYPEELYRVILEPVKEKITAWDCGTGNGQAAGALVQHFTRVWATDISTQQLEQVSPAENIIYSVQSASATDFPPASVDLITVATAVHWFDFDAFYAEVKRVGKPGAVLAVWCYGLLRVVPGVDVLTDDFHNVTLGSSWDPERHYVNGAYQTIPFPFREIETEPLVMELQWTKEQYKGYFNTWSAVKHYINRYGHNPVDAFFEKAERQLPPGDTVAVKLPLHLRMGWVHGTLSKG